MDAVALLLVSFVGTFVWVLNPEAATARYTSQRGWPPALAVLVAAAGQGAALVTLFAFGDQLRRRWRRFDRWCERARARHGERLRRADLPMLCASGLLGVPPASTAAALAPGLGLPARRVLPVLLVARVVRLALVAGLAAQANDLVTAS